MQSRQRQLKLSLKRKNQPVLDPVPPKASYRERTLRPKRFAFATFLFLFIGTSSFANLNVGDKIPALTLMTATGKTINVNTYAKKMNKRNLLFVFFRTGTCQVCTQQLAEFAANYSVIEDANATVLAVSLDDAIVQKQVAGLVEVKFPILLDPDAKTVNKFGTFNPADNLSRPSLFLIGPDQKILYSYIGKEIADRPPFPKVVELLNHYSGLLPKTQRAVSAKPE